MVGVSRKKYIWLYVFGILVLIAFTCSEASSMVNSLDKVVVVLNGSNTGLSEEYKNEKSSKAGNYSSLTTRLEKTSFNCNENSEVCASASSKLNKSVDGRGHRSRQRVEVALESSTSHLIPVVTRSGIKSSSSVTNHRNLSHDKFNFNNNNNFNDYLPVQYDYGPVSEGRGFTTGILFLIFSIIQFKIVFGAMILFLAVSPLILFIMFGPMILFLVFGPMLLMMMV